MVGFGDTPTRSSHRSGQAIAGALRRATSPPKSATTTIRGTGITAYLENGGTLEKARQMAAHASTRTTQLYDRSEDRVTLEEVDQYSGVSQP